MLQQKQRGTAMRKYDPSEELFLRYYLKKVMAKDLPNLIEDDSLSQKEKEQLSRDVEFGIPDLYAVLIARKTLQIEEQRLEIEKQTLAKQNEILDAIKNRHQENTKQNTSTELDDNNEQTLQKQL